MADPSQPPSAAAPTGQPLPSRLFDLAVVVAGLACVVVVVLEMGPPHFPLGGFELFTVPLIMVIARFPLVLDKGTGGIEVGFDSSILMFLMCTLDTQESVLLWTLGVVGTQLTSDKRRNIKLFNIGMGTLAGSVAALLLSWYIEKRCPD